MFLLIRSTSPIHKNPEVAETWNEMPKTPSFVKPLGTFLTTDLEHGVEAFAIFKVEDEHAVEGLQHATHRMMP